LTEADKKKIKPHLSKMAHYCSMQERAVSDVLLKLRNTPLSDDDKNHIVATLKKEGFLDEARYARAFANDKFKLNQWGRIKIGYALRMKQVDSAIIEEGLEQIDEGDYQELITSLATRKLKDTRSTSTADRNSKIARFLLQRGFEPDLVWKTIQGLP
jgi:regulatory protein